MCVCDSVGAFVHVCVCKGKRGMWNWATNTMKNVTENSFCGGFPFFFFYERTRMFGI